MARSPIAPGAMGTVSYRAHANGRVYAGATMRDLAGKLLRLSGAGATEADALAELERKARAVAAVGRGERLHAGSTIAQAVELWLEVQGRSSTVSPQSLVRYRSEGRALVSRVGALQVGDLTAGMVSDVLGDVRAVDGDARARAMRRVLSGVLGLAVRRGAIASNPVRDTERAPAAPRRESTLTPEQFHEVERALMEWGGGSRRGGRKADWRALLAALTLCVTTSARINEVTALTRADVLPGGRLRIAATLVPIPGRAVERQRHTKGKKGRAGEPGRTVVLTARGRDVVEQLLEAAGPDATAPLFPNRDGGHLTVDRMQKRMRSFVRDTPQLWDRLGIPMEQATTHLMRRSALTAVARVAGITVASELAGHSSEAITRRSYVAPARLGPAHRRLIDLKGERRSPFTCGK